MPAMDGDVRRIRIGEWRQYRELRLEALQDAPLAFEEQYPESLARPDEFWQDRVDGSASGAESSMFVAVHAGRFVAKAACFVESDVGDHVSTRIVGVYVTPRLRGSGVAEALLAAVIRWAREEPRADRIRLFVTQTNDRATAFYRRIGFRHTGVKVVYRPDPVHSELEMEYAVSRPGSAWPGVPDRRGR
jgi:ribosomal protein S18 acetylase RimI-like enzyme